MELSTAKSLEFWGSVTGLAGSFLRFIPESTETRLNPQAPGSSRGVRR